jgi:hypothetical protein
VSAVLLALFFIAFVGPLPRKSSTVRATAIWQTLADWANFDESATWQAIAAELRAQFATSIQVDIWGPSPVAPEPLRPGS